MKAGDASRGEDTTVFGLPRLTRIVTAHYGGAAAGRKISHPVAEDQARYGHRPWIEQRIGPRRVPTPRTPGFEFTWAVSRRLRTHGASKIVTPQPAPATSLQRRWCRTVGGPSAAEPIPRCRCAQVSDATDGLPDFNPCCPLQQSASRVHRRGVRSALDGIASRYVVGRIQLVNAILGHTGERSAAALVSSGDDPAVRHRC
jgi:hypothetical protein